MDSNNKIIVDEASASTTYIGEAAIGIAESAAFWRIRKIDTTGSIRKYLWADGNELYDNVWTNRALLAYS